MSRPPRQNILYRFYDEHDQLLYVGITTNPGSRFDKHSHEKDWWKAVARIEIEHFADRNSLLEAERAAIKNEKPVHNIVHAEQRGKALTWLCDVCKKPIGDGHGYITVHYTDIGRAERGRSEWKARVEQKHSRPSGLVAIPLTEYMTYPPAARWHVLHESCDPQLDSEDDYWIAIERIRTLDAVVHWTAHLMGKKWLPHTTWRSLLEEIGCDESRPA